jgi:hypothetical protein
MQLLIEGLLQATRTAPSQIRHVLAVLHRRYQMSVQMVGKPVELRGDGFSPLTSLFGDNQVIERK